MTKRVTMRTGRPKLPHKMIRQQYHLEAELVLAIKKRAGNYKASSWVNSALWAAVKK